MLELGVIALTCHQDSGRWGGGGGMYSKFIPPKKGENIVLLICFWGYILVLERLSNLREALGSRKHWEQVTYFLSKVYLKTPEWQDSC